MPQAVSHVLSFYVIMVLQFRALRFVSKAAAKDLMEVPAFFVGICGTDKRI